MPTLQPLQLPPGGEEIEKVAGVEEPWRPRIEERMRNNKLFLYMQTPAGRAEEGVSEADATIALQLAAARSKAPPEAAEGG